MPAFIVELFRHNRWANLRLLDACAAAGEDDLAAGAPGTYGPVRDTLVHVFAAEERYVREFTSERPEPPLEEEAGFPGLDRLRERAELSGSQLISLAEKARPEDILRGTYRGQPYEIRSNLLFVHAIEHAIQHRTHVVGILSAAGHTMPALDGIAYWREGAAG